MEAMVMASPDNKSRARRRIVYPMFRKSADSVNDAKSQISLEMGSEEYREYVRDLAGLDEEDFVEGAMVTDDKSDSGKRDSEETQELEAGRAVGKSEEHISEFAKELADASEEQADIGEEVLARKYRMRMAKADLVGEMKQKLQKVAAGTDTQHDDKIAAVVSTRTVDDLPDIQDDNVTPSEYVASAADRYF